MKDRKLDMRIEKEKKENIEAEAKSLGLSTAAFIWVCFKCYLFLKKHINVKKIIENEKEVKNGKKS